ncbi:hypothetical protein [Peristeroidobacter soli]|uniref:hypothetical protein n=1 Tax=Peristeroidobacter soli TaxID=2497877 RepID=UPI00101BDE33|nr:hypothetical protein [Peristeroidobacter soli]
MAATIFNSSLAVEMSIHVVRASCNCGPVRLQLQLAERFAGLDHEISSHDHAIVGMLKAIHELMNLDVHNSTQLAADAHPPQARALQ